MTVDSGWRWTCGGEEHAAVYSAMIEEALANPPGADLGGTWWREGGDLHVRLRVANRSGHVLGPDNHAAVSVIVYEKARLMHTGRFSRASAEFPLGSDLADGDTAVYDLDLAGVRLADWGRAVVVGVLDHRPQPASERYAALQSAVLEETTPPTATTSPLPSPTATASPLPSPTETPLAAPTATSTALSTEGPTITSTPEEAVTRPPSGTPTQTSTASPSAAVAPSPTPVYAPPVLLPIAFADRRHSGDSGLSRR